MARQRSTVRIYNRSKQAVYLQVRNPDGEFYTGQQQVRLMPGQDVMLPKSHVMEDQIKNLRAKMMVQVTYDSDAVDDHQAIVTP